MGSPAVMSCGVGQRLTLGVVPHLDAAQELTLELSDCGSPDEHFLLLAATGSAISGAKVVSFWPIVDVDGVTVHGTMPVDSTVDSESVDGSIFKPERVVKTTNLINHFRSRRTSHYFTLISHCKDRGKIALLLELKGAGDNELAYNRLVLKHATELFQTVEL